VEISDSFACAFRENLRELPFRKILVATENSYPHGFVVNRPLSLIVCGVCR